LKALQAYSAIAAEHAYRLLGNAMLADKAKQMNTALYASLLAPAQT
jgi:hypothetical protein